jgi:tripartite-type tricarboxylate transporter receptor subunit TctC
MLKEARAASSPGSPPAFGRRALILTSAAGLSAPALAQTEAPAWPVRQVRFLIPFAAGGGQDIFWRIIAERLSRRLRATFVVENKPGVGGALGAQEVARAAPDGATFLCTSNGISVIPSLYRNSGFDPQRDLTPVSLLCDLPGGCMVRADSPIRSLDDLIARAKAQPGRITYGSGGVGTASQLAVALFASMAAINLLHVPYRGVSVAINALYAGDVDFIFGSTTELIPNTQQGRARTLGVTSTERIPSLPDVPPISDAVPGFSAINWFAMFAPKNLPAPLLQRLVGELAPLAQDQELLARLGEAGALMRLNGPEALATRMSEDVTKWAELIVRENIRSE